MEFFSEDEGYTSKIYSSSSEKFSFHENMKEIKEDICSFCEIVGISVNNDELGSKETSANDWVHKFLTVTLQGFTVNLINM